MCVDTLDGLDTDFAWREAHRNLAVLVRQRLPSGDGRRMVNVALGPTGFIELGYSTWSTECGRRDVVDGMFSAGCPGALREIHDRRDEVPYVRVTVS